MDKKPKKRLIGKKAASLINEGDSIILDSGTTTFEISNNLSHLKKKLTPLIVEAINFVLHKSAI